jgi:hypothetical protein
LRDREAAKVLAVFLGFDLAADGSVPVIETFLAEIAFAGALVEIQARTQPFHFRLGLVDIGLHLAFRHVKRGLLSFPAASNVGVLTLF